MRSTAAADAQQRALQTLMEGYVKGAEKDSVHMTYILISGSICTCNEFWCRKYTYIHTYMYASRCICNRDVLCIWV